MRELMNPYRVRERFDVPVDRGVVVALCRRCGLARGAWPEGGHYPYSLCGPCPKCGHDAELAHWAERWILTD